MMFPAAIFVDAGYKENFNLPGSQFFKIIIEYNGQYSLFN